MPELVATQTSETTPSRVPLDLVQCPRCGSERFKRIPRIGLLYRYFFPLFGYYPWKCGRCGAISRMKMRIQPLRHQRRSRDAEKSDQRESVMDAPTSR